MKSYLTLIFLLFLSFFNSLGAGTGHAFHIDSKKGITNPNITKIIQDQDGYIWVGTKDGLFRYNGYEYKSFKRELGNRYSLSNNTINHLFIDSKQRMWVSTNNGLNLYNRKTESFISFFYDKDNLESLPNSMVSNVYEDLKGRIWIGHFDGISQLIEVENSQLDFKFINYKVSEKISGVENWITKIFDDGKGNLWLGAQFRGIYKFNIKTGKTKNYYSKDLMDINFRVMGINVNNEGNILVFSFNEGIFKYSEDILYKLNQSKIYEINDIYEAENNKILLATNSGLINYNKSENSFHLNEQFENNSTVKDLNTIYIDDSKIVWLGTRSKGLFCYYKPSVNISLINKESHPDLPTERILDIEWINNALYAVLFQYNIYKIANSTVNNLGITNRDFPIWSDGSNYIYTENYIYSLNNEALRRTEFKIKGFDDIIAFSDGKQYYLKNNRIFIVEKDSVIEQIDFKYKEENYSQMFQMELADNILLMNKENLFRMTDLDGNTKVLLNIFETNSFRSGFQKLSANSEYAWIIGDNFLYSYSLKTDSVNVYNQDNRLGEVFYCIIVDDENDVWIAGNKGIVYFDNYKKQFYLFDRSDGIPECNFTGSVSYSDKGSIYFSSDKGIITIDKNSLIQNTFVPPIVFTSLSLFNKEVSIQKGKVKPKEGFYLTSSINETDKLTLKHDQNFISIDFATLNYRSSNKNQYAFYLDGLEKDWNIAGIERRAFYNGIPPGEYIFKVKASNNDGVWNSEAKQLKIRILPPFWKTNWFRALVVFALLTIIALIFYFRFKASEHKKKELEKLVRVRTAELITRNEEILTQSENLKEVNILLQENKEEIQAQAEELFEANNELQKLNSTKDKFFNIIAHDLKNPFQAINGFSEVLLKDFDKHKKEKTKDFIGFIQNSSKKASNLLENLLEWAKTQTNKIKFEPNAIKIYEIANENIELLMVNAKNKNIRLENNIPDDLLVFADKNMLSTVLRNLLNNAIKFTPDGGAVCFSGRVNYEYAEIILTDTGVGMSEKIIKKLFRIDQQISTSGTAGESGTGLGLIITNEFIEKNNGDIRVESEPGHGSKFIIQLPIDGRRTVIKIDKKIDELEQKPKENDMKEEATLNVQPIQNEKPLLLIAEDTVDIRVGIKSYLEDEFIIIEAVDGEEGKEYAFDLIPDLIITDWMMPNMNGIELTQKLKTDSRTSHIPIIMLTAKSTPSNKIEGFETGADEYLTKPFEYNLLKARIKNLIQSRISLQKIFSGNKADNNENKLSRLDRQFINKLISLFEEEIDNSEYNINDLCDKMNMSRSQFYRKVKALTGFSPSDFFRNFRIKKAAQLIKESGENISEIMYSVGFSGSGYFAKCFKDVFGCSPKEYARRD